MRVLVTTVAQSAHLYNLVPLAWALHTAGHEVCVVSHHDLADKIVGTGLTAVSLGDPVPPARHLTMADFAYPEPRPPALDWDYMLGKFAVFSGLMFPFYESEPFRAELIAFARDWRPDLVLWDMFSFTGGLAAAVSGAAHVRVLSGLDVMGQMRSLFLGLLRQQPPQSRDDPLAEWLSLPLEPYGLDFDEQFVTGQRTIDPMPPAMRLPVDPSCLPVDHAYLPVRHVPYHGPAPVPRWIYDRPARPRVCLTLGLTGREGWDVGKVTAAELMAAVDGLDAEVIATLSEDQVRSVARIPDNVRVVDFVPLHALLPTCSAVIHHGGTGTFNTALVHGVPQLVVPHTYWDSTAKAGYVADQGAGLALYPDAFSVEALRDGLQRLLGDSSYRDGAARAQAELNSRPSPNELVSQLIDVCKVHR